jgi:hypothetical protein
MTTTVDIACFHIPADPATPMLQQLAVPAGGTTVSGSNKLAQRVVIELMTELGSQLYSGRGTLFLTRLRTSAYTETDVLVAFSSIKPTLRNNIQTEELSTDDPAERYLDSYIDQIVITPNAVQLRLSIMSRAGLTTVLTLPVLVFVYH